MDIVNTAWITAGIASATALWSTARGWFSRLSSIVIITIDVTDLQDAVLYNLNTNYKKLSLGQKRFTKSTQYVKPLSRYRYVAFEIIGQTMTFLKGFMPIFLSYSVGSNTSAAKASVTFLRGSLNIEGFIIQSVESYNDVIGDKSVPRFRINRHFGRSHSPNNNLTSSPSYVDETNEANKPLKWAKKELGQPTPEAPFSSLAYGENVKEFMNYLNYWSKSEKWFKSRNIPWRTGALLYGSPGTGKSSFAKALAQEINVPIELFDLPSMSNEELIQTWKQALENVPAIVLFEDIDRLFDDDKNLKGGTDTKSKLTLDCLLNCISGVENADGLIVLMTANDISKLDSALGIPDATGKSSRPGRLDRCVFFGELDEVARRQIAGHILKGYESYIDQVVKDGAGETGAQFQKRCTDIAVKLYWDDYNKSVKTDEKLRLA